MPLFIFLYCMSIFQEVSTLTARYLMTLRRTSTARHKWYIVESLAPNITVYSQDSCLLFLKTQTCHWTWRNQASAQLYAQPKCSALLTSVHCAARYLARDWTRKIIINYHTGTNPVTYNRDLSERYTGAIVAQMS